VTLIELFKLLRKHLKLVIILPVLFALATGVYAYAAMPNQYTSTVSMYVLTKTSTSNDQGISNSDLTASQLLTNDVASLIKSDHVQQDAANQLGMATLSDYKISVDSETTTRVITLSVTGTDAARTADVANQLAASTDSVAREVMNVESINVVDQAIASPAPSGPPRAMYVAVAFLLGLFVAIAIVVIADMVNTRVRSSEEASELLDDLPVIGRIPVIKA
jgi:capsular polysaccharide biosynthesis protein